MPARFDWLGTVSTDALDAANWSSMEEPGGLPGEDDHLYFNASLVVNPPGEVGGPPSPGGGLSVNCDNLQSLGDGFAGVHIGATYSGTVTMGEALTFGEFDLANGAISQSASAYDLTVTGTFNWTGGVLNSSTTAATFTLSGATATVSPGANNTITTGSTLNLVARETGTGLVGTNATFTSGEVLFANGLGLIIDSLCTANMQPNNPQSPKVDFRASNVELAGVTEINIKANGLLLVFSGTFDSKNIPLRIEGGSLEVQGTSTAKFGGRVGGVEFGPPGAPNGPSVYLNNGQIGISQGGTLTAPNGLLLKQSGNPATNLSRLVTLWNAVAAAAGQNQPDATIIGNLNNSGADVVMCVNQLTRTKFGRLVVQGTVDWSGGVYRPVVSADGTNPADADLWYATGTFTISNAAAKLAPGTVNAQGVPNVQQPAVGKIWRIIYSADRLVVNALPPITGNWNPDVGSEQVGNELVPRSYRIVGKAA